MIRKGCGSSRRLGPEEPWQLSSGDEGGGCFLADEKTGWSEGQKWVAGVASSLVVGILIALATRPGGWLNPEPTPTPAKAAISVVEFDSPFVLNEDGFGTAHFTIANEGDAVARGCEMRGNTFSGFGDEFSVQPDGTTRITRGVTSLGLDPGSYDFTVWVECQNAVSARVTKSITVGAQ